MRRDDAWGLLHKSPIFMKKSVVIIQIRFLFSYLCIHKKDT